MSNTRIIYEQAVYGSFAFREGGYGLLANSPGCLPEWKNVFVSACQKFGEPSGGAAFDRVIFSLRLFSGGPWVIVGVCPAGHDDRGRPGALAFHGLFVEEREFRKIGFDPFAIVSELRFDWSAENASLLAKSCPIASTRVAQVGLDPCSDISSTTRRLIDGRRVAIESAKPIEDLARQVWSEVPEKIRKKTSMATWAFANGNQFDFVAVPRLEAIEWDASYAEPMERKASTRRPFSWKKPAYITITLVLSMLILSLWNVASRDRRTSQTSSRSEPIFSPVGPDPASYRNEVPDASELQAVSQALAEFADRFGIPLDGNPPDLTAAMIRLADRLRYRGALLTKSEQAQLAKENVPGRSRAMAWDLQIRRFIADRPLPKNFEQGPLRWKLDTFAWSFHVDPQERLSTAEIPRAIADTLTLDEPIGANPLASRYRPLAEYARFLAKLPVR